MKLHVFFFFFFSSRRRHTRLQGDWSSDVCSSDLQWIRAERLRDLGLVDVLHPEQLDARALTEWLARDLGPPPASRSRIDLGGLTRIPGLLAELLGVPAGPLQTAASAAAEGGLT